MGRTLKWITGIIVAVIVLIVIVGYFILTSYDFNHLKPRIAKAAKDATGRELTIGGDIELEIGLRPSLVLRDIAFQNASWGSRPEMAKIKRFEVQVAILPLIRGNIDIQRFILSEPDILIETDKSGRSNLTFEAPKAPAPGEPKEKAPPEGPARLPGLAFKKLLVEKGRLDYRDGQSGKTLHVILNNFLASVPDMNGPLEFSLDGNYDKIPFDMRGQIGPLTAVMQADQALTLKVTAKAFDATVNLDGAIKDPMTRRGIDVGFVIQVPDLKEISQFAGRPLPPVAPVEVAGRAADTGPGAYKLSELKLAFAGNTLLGNLAANVAGKVPQITADLSSERLDLRPLLKNEKPKEAPRSGTEKTTKKSDRVFPDDPLVLDALKTVNAGISVKAGRILLPQLAVNDFNTTVVLKDGHLMVKPIKASIGGGTLNGSLALKTGGKDLDMTTEIKVAGFDAGKMLKELGVTELIEGNIDADIDLKGRGGSIAKLMAGLDGHVSVIMGQGRIHNRYINLLGADLQAGIFQMINPSGEKDGYTAVKCMVNRFDIRKGVANTTILVFDTELMSVIGDGIIDLRTEKLDLALEPSPKKGVAGLGLSLGELAKPFKLAGTLAAPSLAIDPAKAALMAGKIAGGVATFGLAGIASALLGAGTGEANPCPAALDAARTGVKPSVKKPAAEKESAPGTPQKQLEEAVPDIGKTLKGLFGR